MNKLAYFREQRGLSQRDVADMLGVSQPTIQRAETEHDSAKLGTYKRYADILGITLADVFGDRSEVEKLIFEHFENADEQERAYLLDLVKTARSRP